jgi:hypothetical protein
MFAEINEGKLVISVPLNNPARETKGMWCFAESQRWEETAVEVELPDGSKRKLIVNLFAGAYKRAKK